MDIYMSERNGSQNNMYRIALSMLPEKVKQAGDAKFNDYDIIGIGEVKIPNGTKLLTVSFSGIFPGKGRQNASYVKSYYWQEPKELVNIIESWRRKGSRIQLMVTETHINHIVYVSSFDVTNSGGNGDIEYDISFIEAPELTITTVLQKQATVSNNTTRPAPAAAAQTTYTVKKGDTLWAIAKKYLGSGARYPEIYNLNKGVIGSNPNLIKPGQVLTIPG